MFVGVAAIIKANREVLPVGPPDIPTNIKLVQIPKIPTGIQIEI